MAIWMWIGHYDTQFNGEPEYTLTQEEADRIGGYKVSGPNEIKTVEMDGSNVGLEPGQWPEALENEWFPTFNQYYGLPSGQPGSAMFYDSPRIRAGRKCLYYRSRACADRNQHDRE